MRGDDPPLTPRTDSPPLVVSGSLTAIGGAASPNRRSPPRSSLTVRGDDPPLTPRTVSLPSRGKRQPYGNPWRGEPKSAFPTSTIIDCEGGRPPSNPPDRQPALSWKAAALRQPVARRTQIGVPHFDHHLFERFPRQIRDHGVMCGVADGKKTERTLVLGPAQHPCQELHR